MRLPLLAFALAALATAGCHHHRSHKRSIVVEYVPAPAQLPPAYYTPPPCR
ncbi:hypothetical protein [Limnoglobus roseus]|uniref:hypothetical protein n=1 Tax=Limnoglobus roseus TaxID=2598579 RepID=UPI00143D89A5|nr:hypothetical protein [Limnoglobus roseus]